MKHIADFYTCSRRQSAFHVSLLLLVCSAFAMVHAVDFDTVITLPGQCPKATTILFSGIDGALIWGRLTDYSPLSTNPIYRPFLEPIANTALFPLLFEVMALGADGHVYFKYAGTVRHYVGGFSLWGSNNDRTWENLGTGGDWPKEYALGFAMAAKSAPNREVFVSFMYANTSVAVVRHRLTNTSSWEFVPFANNTVLYSSMLQSPTMKVAKNGDMYLLVADTSCSERNATVLRLVNGTNSWVIIGQRCFCDAVNAHLLPVHDSFVIVVDATQRSIWKYDNSSDRFFAVAVDYTSDATYDALQIGARNSTTIVALGRVPNGVTFMWFNWCTNRFESQTSLTLNYARDTFVNVVTNMSPDGFPYIFYFWESNPVGHRLPDRYVTLYTFSRDVPLDNRAKCVPCPSGPSSASSASCSTCPVGFVSTVFGTCSSCGIARSYRNTTGIPVCACRPGFYSETPTSACLPCTGKGVSSAYGSSSCNYCRSPYAQNADHTACTLCPPGTFYVYPDNADYICALCFPGTYTSNYGMHACDNCPAGTYSPASGLSSCSPCPIGTSTNGAHARTSPADCVPCAEGTYNANLGGVCTPCPAGTFGTTRGTSSCTPCPAGTANSNVGQRSCRNCTEISLSTGAVNCPEDSAAFGHRISMTTPVFLAVMMGLWLFC